MMSAASSHSLMIASLATSATSATTAKMHRRGAELGVTRWASPPPGISLRALAVILILGDVGYLLLVGSIQ